MSPKRRFIARLSNHQKPPRSAAWDMAASQAAGYGRRRALGRIGGLAVAGAAGGTFLSELLASPAGAATDTETGAVAPSVVQLTDAPTVTVDASLGNDFRLTLGGNRTMGGPTNGAEGQQIIFQITQGPGGPFALSWAGQYEFSAGIAAPVLSTGTGQTDLLGFMYSAAASSWFLVAYLNGFA